jgi:flagella basal body P-ring formation protein FlgA
MNRITPSALIRVIVLAVLLQTAAATVQAQEVIVTLLPDAIVDDTIVTLDQIAKLSGGSTALRKRLGKLDVIDFPSSVSHRVVTSDQVRFRLLLADMEAAEFRMSGARRTTIVEPDEPITLRRLLAAAEQALAARYPGDLARAAVTPSKSIDVPSLETRPGDRIRLDAVVKGPVALNGRSRVDVSLNVNGKTREVVPVFLDVAQPAKLAPGESPGAKWTPAAGPADVLIKAHDNVKLVAVIGSARVEAVGEAQQDGKIGQVIRVRNVESNRIVHGRVEAGGAVIVEY